MSFSTGANRKLENSMLNYQKAEKRNKTHTVCLCAFFWATWKEKNRVVFDDNTLSLNRLKVSFSCSLHSWAGLIPNVDLLVRILLCILSMNPRS